MSLAKELLRGELNLFISVFTGFDDVESVQSSIPILKRTKLIFINICAIIIGEIQRIISPFIMDVGEENEENDDGDNDSDSENDNKEGKGSLRRRKSGLNRLRFGKFRMKGLSKNNKSTNTINQNLLLTNLFLIRLEILEIFLLHFDDFHHILMIFITLL